LILIDVATVLIIRDQFTDLFSDGSYYECIILLFSNFTTLRRERSLFRSYLFIMVYS